MENYEAFMEEAPKVEKLSGSKVFFILWAISFAIMYFLASRPGNPLVLPGDIYTKKGVNNIYIPTGSSLYLAIILFILAKFIFKV